MIDHATNFQFFTQFFVTKKKHRITSNVRISIYMFNTKYYYRNEFISNVILCIQQIHRYFLVTYCFCYEKQKYENLLISSSFFDATVYFYIYLYI